MAVTGSRTLTLKLLADINAFTSNLDKGKKDVDSFTDRIGDFSKKAALAFAAVGAAVGAYAKKAVQAAADDEEAQLKLAKTIEATTDASNKQIASVEKWITKTSIAIGITDDELRPAFARLVRSTNDVEEAQKLLNLALDLSAATGKPLETVANALGKAYDGNTTALGKLGLGIDAGILKSKDFNKIFKDLDGTFGNFAEETAGTTQKGIDRVRIALDEANESIGMALLPIVQDLTDWILVHFVPALEAMIGGLTGDESVKEALNGTYEEFYRWGERIRSIIKTVINLKDEIIIVAGVMATMFVASKIAAGVAATITVINTLIKAYNALKASSFIAGVAAYFALNPAAGVAAAAAGIAVIAAATKYIGGTDTDTVAMPASATPGAGYLGSTPGIYGSGGTGKGVTAGGGAGGGSTGGVTVPSGSKATTSAGNLGLGTGGVFDPGNFRISENAGMVPGITATSGFDPSRVRRGEEASVNNVTVNIGVAGDPEGTARTIVDVLNRSYARGTGGAAGLYAV